MRFGDLLYSVLRALQDLSLFAGGLEYSLEGLSEHRCPECGTAFDPRDPNTFGWRQHRPYWKIVVSSIMLGWLVTFIGFSCWAYFGTPPGGWFSGPRGAIFIGLFMSIIFWYFALIPAALIACAWILLERSRRDTSAWK